MSNEHTPQSPKAVVQHLIDHGFARHRPLTTFPEFEVYELDLTHLKLNVSFFVPFIVPRQLTNAERVSPAEVRRLWHKVEGQFGQRHKMTVLLLGGTWDAGADEQIHTELGQQGVVVWDQSVMQKIVRAPDYAARAKIMGLELVSQIGREALSPYVSGRPAVGGRFFGRSTQLRQILPEDSNCTILGNRRIGKTSLLKEIKERLKLKGFRTAEVYGATCHTTEDFVVKLLAELGEFQKQQQVIKNPYHATSLPRWLKQIAVKEPVAVFVDELDHILDFDAQQDYTLMNMLREIFESNEQCRVFFAGFRRVMSEREMVGSPLFNFTRPIDLGGFSQDETYEMVAKPLSHLGIDLAGSDLSLSIYQTTAGHPEQIQIWCAEVIRLYEEDGHIPDIKRLSDKVLDSTEYKQKVFGAFLSNTNPIEALACYLLIRGGRLPGEYEFKIADIGHLLEQYGEGISHDNKTVTGLINNLTVSGIIDRVRGSDTYRFSSPMLIRYCQDLDIDKSIRDALKKAKETPDLYHTPPHEEEIHLSQE